MFAIAVAVAVAFAVDLCATDKILQTDLDVPVAVSLLRLVVLRRVLGFYSKNGKRIVLVIFLWEKSI